MDLIRYFFLHTSISSFFTFLGRVNICFARARPTSFGIWIDLFKYVIKIIELIIYGGMKYRIPQIF